jgi:hypothetical protein
MSTTMLENLEYELEVAADRLSMSPEAESTLSTWCYWDVWTWTAAGWRYLAREGPFQMTKDQAVGHVLTLQLKYRVLAQNAGGGTPVVQCFAYLPVSKRYVPCQNWF